MAPPDPLAHEDVAGCSLLSQAPESCGLLNTEKLESANSPSQAKESHTAASTSQHLRRLNARTYCTCAWPKLCFLCGFQGRCTPAL